MNNHLAILNEVLQFQRRFQRAEHLVQESLTFIAQLTGWAGLALLLPDHESGIVRVMASTGALVPPSDEVVSADHPLIVTVLQTKFSHYVADTPGAALVFPLSIDHASVLLVPLKRGEWVNSLLYIVSDTPNAFDADARLLAELLGEILSSAFQNAELYVSLRREAFERRQVEDRFWATTRKTETLYFVTRALIAPHYLDDILPAVLNSIANALRTNVVWLLRCDPVDRQVHTFLAGGAVSSEAPQLSYADLAQGVVGEVLHDGRPFFLTKTAMEARARAEETQPWYITEAVGAVAVAPLLLQDQPCGVLLAVNGSDQPDFAQPDVDLLMAIAAQIVSAMQRAELFQAVEEERERLRTVVQSSRDGVILLGVDLRLLVVNWPAVRFLGLPGEPEAWIDRSLWDVVHTLRDHARHVVKIILGEMRRIRDGDEHSHDGEAKVGLRTIQWVSWPVRGDVQLLGRLFVMRDVTDARLLDQFRDDLTHTMVHDLRNPLTGIHAALTLLLRGAGDSLLEGQRRIITIALLSAERMVKLVNAILDISRLETGQMPLKPIVFRFSDVLRDSLELQKLTLTQHDLNFVNAVPEDVPLVRADRELVERVLQNLMGNAFKFTPAGGEIAVRAEIGPEMPDKLCISVSDTGPGIPPEIRRNLFTKFVAGQQSERGSGLGLAFCRMVLEAHGERIWVAETSEQGTTFTFTLPLAGSAS
ncbi:MAG: GAF domain-containing protein [Anaerolineae bacterium]|nr:GAF domain-containing protein [Anaerolineae bacterium]